jgi:hypothetical protein
MVRNLWQWFRSSPWVPLLMWVGWMFYTVSWSGFKWWFAIAVGVGLVVDVCNRCDEKWGRKIQ